jgi:alpha-ribazole phosphatase
MDRLRMEEHKKVLLITHAGVIRCLWAYLLEIPLQNIFKIPVAYNEIFIFNLTKNSNTDSIKRIK